MKKKKGDKEKKELKEFKKRIRSVVKIIISVILGFLPSFLFVVLFVQYGSPFSNYLKFLSNFNSSFWAWIAAVIIISLIYFIGKIIQTKKSIKTVLKNKFVLALLIFCFAIIIALVALQLYLYINFTLRNDILTKLFVDKDNIFFTNQSKEEITFKVSVTMNPFCTAQCDYNFVDVSNGKEIERGSFTLTSILYKPKTYVLDNRHLIEGSQELYRFEVSCKSKRTFLCYTKEAESERAALITLNYNLTEEDTQFKNESRNEITLIWNKLYSSYGKINESINNIHSINNSFSTEFFLQKAENLSGVFSELNKSFVILKSLWGTQNFSVLREQLPYVRNRVLDLNEESEELISEINQSIIFYNNLKDAIDKDRIIIHEISQINFTDSLCSEFNNLVINFNNAIEQFKEESNLSGKIIIVENISYEINSFYNKSMNSHSGSVCSLNEAISDEHFKKIEIISHKIQIPAVSLEKRFPVCCYRRKCKKCCDGDCSKNDYPVIFLHGYSLNKAIPIGYGLDNFADIKEKLSSEGYIDIGGVIISSVDEPKGLWGKINGTPITMTASYFFDTYKTTSGEKTVPSSIDSIDTYAIRLKSIIDLVKYRTNKDKVIIIAHSMGGLVTRRYIQVFGGYDIDKVILIAIPNHGIEGKVRDYCSLFGPEVACSEMDKNSLFINKLNNSPTDIIPVYNIVGIGCNMGDETGDGILKNSTQYLNYATNYYITGSCDELTFDFFHENIIHPDKTPEIYEIIKKILGGDEKI